MGTYEEVGEAVRKIQERLGLHRPSVGIILGSGLGSLTDGFEAPQAIPFEEVPHFPRSSVPGHPGRLVLGKVGSERVIAMQGRVHYYEGHSPQQVIFPTRVLCALGIRVLVVTNSAGGINPSFRAGNLMIITDHINLSGWSALVGPNDERLGPRFPDMSAAYDPRLIAKLSAAAQQVGIDLQRGVYASQAGPAYETPAEIRALRILGADAVGMSTVPEVVAARHMGVAVAGISCITNPAAGLGQKPLSHQEVAETAAKASSALALLLFRFIPSAVTP